MSAAIRPFSQPPWASSLAAMEQNSLNASSLLNISSKIALAEKIVAHLRWQIPCLAVGPAPGYRLITGCGR